MTVVADQFKVKQYIFCSCCLGIRTKQSVLFSPAPQNTNLKAYLAASGWKPHQKQKFSFCSQPPFMFRMLPLYSHCSFAWKTNCCSEKSLCGLRLAERWFNNLPVPHYEKSRKSFSTWQYSKVEKLRKRVRWAKIIFLCFSIKKPFTFIRKSGLQWGSSRLSGILWESKPRRQPQDPHNWDYC